MNDREGWVNALFAPEWALYGWVNAAYGWANGPCAPANAPYGRVNAAYGSVNAPYGRVNGPFAWVNAAYGSVNAAYGCMNGPYSWVEVAKFAEVEWRTRRCKGQRRLPMPDHRVMVVEHFVGRRAAMFLRQHKEYRHARCFHSVARSAVARLRQ
jgi:hypothetical protein